jgi:hypothetical protein
VQPHVTTSPLAVVPEIVAVVVLVAVWWSTSAGVVRSFAQQLNPLVAVMPGVMVTVHVPAVPLANFPPHVPPTLLVREHPLIDCVPVAVGGLK